MMAAIRRRISQLGRIPARMWHHGRTWISRRSEVANWGKLWNLSNPIRVLAERRLSGKTPTEDIVIRFRSGLNLAVDATMREDLASLVDTYTGYMGKLGVPLIAGDVVVDVGAHIGSFSIRAFFENPGIRILAFEPDPKNFQLLRANARLNGIDDTRFEAYNLAVSGTEEELMFSRGKTSTTGSLARTGFFKASPDAELLPVSATTIESIFRDHSIDRCRLLKVDCEGSEYDLLARVPDGILSRIENIVVEVHPARAGTPEALKAILVKRGFEVSEDPHANGCSDLYCRRLRR